ncbi:MAG: hypothetical protein ACK5SY_00780 [bacterium]
MATDKELGLTPKGTYPAKVIEVIDDFKVVINRGELNSIRIDASHLVYSITNKPIYDPITSDFIGHCILYKGSGRIISVEENTSIIQACNNSRYNCEKFINVCVGDLVIWI